ncbi:9451_t:CDS:2 [Entrophospora sp. SA101]|nr:9451_t:CDS:2 [Entrophospora sp. SA101]
MASSLDGPSSPLTSTQYILTSNFDLQEILSQFETQPDPSKIILTLKVERDKRRAEEAKLRVREFDLILMDRHRQRRFAEHVEGMDVSNNTNNYEEQLILLNNEPIKFVS